MRESRTRTRANSAATKKPLRPTRNRASNRLNQDKKGSSKSIDPRRRCGVAARVGDRERAVRPSRYEAYYTVAARPDKPGSAPFATVTRRCPSDGVYASRE